jgi:hypothetical protein
MVKKKKKKPIFDVPVIVIDWQAIAIDGMGCACHGLKTNHRVGDAICSAVRFCIIFTFSL